jgi:hypothetical protein
MFRRSICLLAFAVLCGSAPVAHAGIPSGRYAIGDSVMLGAKPKLQHRHIKVNAVESRQFRDVVPLARKLRKAGALRHRIIVHLGTNGILIDPADCDRLSEIAGRKRHVFLVTIRIPRSYTDTQNSRLRACASRHGNTSLIDWYAYSNDHRNWFYDDGYHLNGTGRRKYAVLLDRRSD